MCLGNDARRFDTPGDGGSSPPTLPMFMLETLDDYLRYGGLIYQLLGHDVSDFERVHLTNHSDEYLYSTYCSKCSHKLGLYFILAGRFHPHLVSLLLEDSQHNDIINNRNIPTKYICLGKRRWFL